MADFNPQVPAGNPTNSAFWARPVQQPRADISQETLYKGLGKSFDEAVEGVDDFIKHGVISPIEQKDLGAARNEFADALNTARSYVNQGTSYTSGDKPSLMSGGQNIPTAVAEVGDKMQVLHDSMNGGHLSETDYYGRVDRYLQRLRTMFPGYRDFIDQEAYRITGVHPANQEIRSAIGDLNRLMTEHQGHKDEFTSLSDWAVREGVLPPDIYDDYQRRYRQNPGDYSLVDQMRADINKRRQYITADRIAEGDYKRNEQNRKVADEGAKQGMNDHFSQERDLFLDHASLASGLWKGANMRSWLTDLGNGVIKPTDPGFSESMALTATQIQTKIDQMKAAWTTYAMQKYPGYGGTGDSGVQSMIKENLQPLQDMVDHLHKGEASWFSVTADMTKGMRADNELTLQQKYGKLRDSLAFIKSTGAENLIPQGMYADVGQKLQEVYKNDWAQAVAQPGLMPGGDGQVMTLNKAMEDWKSKGATKENYDQLMRWRDMLVDKNVPQAVKENIAKFFYSVDNWQNFRKYNWAEPDKIYNRMFNELVSKNMSKLPTEDYQMYRGAAEAEGATLFGNNMETLRGFERGGAGDVKFIWHSEPVMVKGKMTMLEATGVRVPGGLQDALDNLNSNFMGIKSVYDHDPSHKGTPVEEYVAHMMMEHGVDPTRNIEGMPEKIARSIKASMSPPKPITPGEETGKVKTLEEK